jgi:hypothetical protein
MRMVLHVLDCFCGSGSVEKALNRYFPGTFDVVSLDIKPETLGYKPTIVTDILEWNYRAFPPDHFDVVWLSPVCTQYSQARTTAKLPRNLELADALSLKAKEITQYFASSKYVIENPRRSMLWSRPHMLDMPDPVVTDYCMYGLETQKPTGICSNVSLSLRVCRAKEKCQDRTISGKRKHSKAMCRIYHTSESTSIVPGPLIKSIFEQLTHLPAH